MNKNHHMFISYGTPGIRRCNNCLELEGDHSEFCHTRENLLEDVVELQDRLTAAESDVRNYKHENQGLKGDMNSLVLANNKTIELLISERDQLRTIISECAASAGAYIGDASIEFMAQLPKEIELCISKLRAQVDAANSQEPVGFNDFIAALQDAGWKDAGDAQWDGASKLHEKWFAAQMPPQQTTSAESVQTVDDKHILFMAEKFIPAGFLIEQNKNILWFAKAVIGAATPMTQPLISNPPKVEQVSCGGEPKNPGVAFLQDFINDTRFDSYLNALPDRVVEKFHDRINSVIANCDDWKLVCENLEEDIAKLKLSPNKADVPSVPEGLLCALEDQTQLDAHGCRVGVVREALDQAMEILAQLSPPKDESI